MSGFTKTVIALLIAGGILFIAGGLWLPAKAGLAQLLLHSAWEESQFSAGAIKPWPWADTWPVGRIIYKKKNIDQIILAGENGEALAFGPGHLQNSGLPGEEGHTILSGHRDTSFSFLKHLQMGDELEVEGRNGRKKYLVVRTDIVESRNFYLNREVSGLLTLITCYPFNAVLPQTPLRFVVTAESLPESAISML